MKPLQVNGGIEPVNLVDIFYFFLNQRALLNDALVFITQLRHREYIDK